MGEAVASVQDCEVRDWIRIENNIWNNLQWQWVVVSVLYYVFTWAYNTFPGSDFEF